MGASMRLGVYTCSIQKGSHSFEAYKSVKISERHRHRYEFNNAFHDTLKKNGWVAAGVNKGANLVEIAELKDHPFMVGSQFHPEFLSRPNRPHPLFYNFIKASLGNL